MLPIDLLPIDLLNPLQFSYKGLVAQFESRFGKGEFHAGALFRKLFQTGQTDLSALTEFDANPTFRAHLASCLKYELPPISQKVGDGATSKFTLRFPDGLESESVVIPMRHYKSLCISSQVGCKMGCQFCETAQMGFLRHLTVSEIVSQVMVARFVLREPVSNLVFMGMGEPMDNLDNVLEAIRIVSDQRGLSIPKSSITVSTVGHVPGIRRLASLASDTSPGGFSRLRLAVSLNAPNDEIRSRIMPINRSAPLVELKRALLDYPLLHKNDFLLMEYVLIPGINDQEEHALQVAEYLKELRTCVNLIPYNPRRNSPFEKTTREQVERFFGWLMAAGQYCRVRSTKGQSVMAACGQLGNGGREKSSALASSL